MKRIFAYIIYNVLLLILLPVMAVYFIWRLVVKGKSRQGFSQRMGFMPVMPNGTSRRMWIHAVSAGEAMAARPILQELKKKIPDVELVLSTTTPAGNDMARKNIPEADSVVYFPLDLPPIVARALKHVKPMMAMTIETELWPNFFHIARSRGIRTAVVNGRIAGKTLKSMGWLGPIYRWVTSNLDLCCMQTRADAERIIAMGADPSRVRVFGNTKFDQPLPGDALERVARLRVLMGIPEGTDLFAAGSTNPGEDEPVIEAFLHARNSFPNLRLLIAPRQLERTDEIIALLAAHGLTGVRRSTLTPESPAPEGTVLLLDTMGELAVVFGLATVAFVGGSLIKKGGHNILQPLAWGKPVFFGPYMHKSRDSAELALSNEIGFQIKSGVEMGEEIVRLLSNRELLAQISAKAIDALERNRGAAERCAVALAELMESRL